MNQFDLNIQNYKKTELEEIFELPEKYDGVILESKSMVLIDNIVKDTTIQPSTRDNTIQFIHAAKKILAEGSNLLKKMDLSDVYNVDKGLKTVPTTDVADHFIIQKPATPYSQSSPSEYYAGTINPLNKRVLYQNLSVDTRFRSNYYSTSSTNFHFDLPIKFSNIVSMQLAAIEFPTTFYSISKQLGNNFFWVSISTFTASAPDSKDIEKGYIFIPDGNYSPESLMDYLNHFVVTNPDFSGFTYLSKLVFSVILTSDNTKSVSGSGQVAVGFSQDYSETDIALSLNFQEDRNGHPDYFTPLPLKLGWLMGFREGVYIHNLNYVSEGIINLSGLNYIYLAIDDYNNNVNNSFYSAFNSSILNKNILARITLNTGAFNVVTQNNLNIVTNARKYFGPVDIQKLNIQVLDEYGRILDLNHMDYSFCLTFQYIYDL